jgi:ribonuclease R
MIEECMVAANEAVAKELWANGIKILARLHEPPDPEKILTLRAELRGLGVRLGNIENPKVFAQFLKSIRSHPLYATIAVMVLRSMKKALYDSSSIGHFGLAKKYYAHFTSPIRRYPDLTLHRQLAARITGGNPRVSPKQLARWAEHASEMEETAAEAERALLEIKKFRLMEAELASRAGVCRRAVVSKCTPFGCFVEIPELGVSGLVHVSRLARGFVRFNESDMSLSAGGGKSWRAGDRIDVSVDNVDFRQRRIDFVPCRRRG